MGRSISITFAYGLAPFEEGVEPWRDEDGAEVMEPEDWLLQHSGVELPERPADPVDWNNRDAADVKAFMPYWTRRSEILDQCGIQLSQSGVDDSYTEWHVIVSATAIHGSYSVELPDLAAKLALEAEAKATLAAFCARAGIEMDAPGWYIIANYG